MANPEHVEIVRRGIAAINDWLFSHPGEAMDLSDGVFSRAQLGGVNLPRANLRDADLEEVNLSGADLREAVLIRANLITADLVMANMTGARLAHANLNGARLDHVTADHADLRGASLWGTNLTNATLRGASFGGAFTSNTVFGNTDLTFAEGLEAVDHMSPSVIDFNTLMRSGELPLRFLRGCGLPDQVIEYLPSLLSQAIEFYSCFISYSSKDQVFAERLHADLQEKGVRCWFAPDDMKIGDRLRLGIDEAIRLHDKLLLILSRHSVLSPWVETEVEAALERERRQKRTVLFPIRIDEAVMRTRKAWAADIRRTRQIGDFRRWKDHDEYQKAFERLLRDLKAESKKTSPAT